MQKPVSSGPPRSRRIPPLQGASARKLEEMIEGVEEGPLREALKRLGTAVYTPNRRLR